MVTKDDAEAAFNWTFNHYINALHRICNVFDKDPTYRIFPESSEIMDEYNSIIQCKFFTRMLKCEFGITMYTSEDSEEHQKAYETAWNRLEKYTGKFNDIMLRKMRL